MRCGNRSRRSAIPLVIIGLLTGALVEGRVQAGDPGETARLPSTEYWAKVLERHRIDGGVDYAALREARGDLDVFLSLVAIARPANANREEAMAFWINAYNAVVLEFVLERYPGIRSVMDFPGFFTQQTTVVAGEEMTLDQIEARALEPGDPRVHFGLVCASRGCPDLREEPYDGRRLDLQLDDQTRVFMADREKGLRLDGEAGVLWVSSIFKWYGGDFTGGSTAVAYLRRGRLVDWIAEYLSDETVSAIDTTRPSVRYIEYDWQLNDRRR